MRRSNPPLGRNTGQSRCSSPPRGDGDRWSSIAHSSRLTPLPHNKGFWSTKWRLGLVAVIFDFIGSSIKVVDSRALFWLWCFLQFDALHFVLVVVVRNDLFVVSSVQLLS